MQAFVDDHLYVCNISLEYILHFHYTVFLPLMPNKVDHNIQITHLKKQKQ